MQKFTRMQDFACKIIKISAGVTPPDPHGGRGRPPPCTLPHTAAPWAGALRAPGSADPAQLHPPHQQFLDPPLAVSWAFVHLRYPPLAISDARLTCKTQKTTQKLN